MAYKPLKTILWVALSTPLVTGCQSASYNVPPQSTPDRGWQGMAVGDAYRPSMTASSVEHYADHLFDGPAAEDFLGALSMGYRELARERDSASDFIDAARFLQRAGAAARGERIWPEEINARILPRYALQDLVYARTRLMRAYDLGADQRYPRIAARAQVAFDCWMESQEENRFPEYVHRCRQTFEDAMSGMEIQPLAKQSSQRAMPAAEPAREPSCPSNSCTPLTLYFDLDQDSLGEAERAKLASWAESIKTHPLPIIVAAHADRSASERYNQALSERRLAHVLGLLASLGVAKERIVSARATGERELPIKTPDGVREPRNRVAEIWLLGR